MKELGKDIQILIQTEKSAGGFACEGFAGVPVVKPSLIAIVTAGDPQAQALAQTLQQQLSASILNFSANITAVYGPCQGSTDRLLGCDAHQISGFQKLLVLVGDKSTAFPDTPDYQSWAFNGNSYGVMPVFPTGADVVRLLPASIQYRNAAFWNSSISEVIPKIFATVGLTARDFRLFISYTRRDPAADSLSEQLFDELSKERYEVYLDRYKTPPAVDFAVRIEQELKDKSMVLFLESQQFTASTWCMREVLYAKQYRLGILALQMPGEKAIPGIYAGSREKLTWADFTHPNNPGELTKLALQRVVSRIHREHGLAVVQRRSYIQQAMLNALIKENAASPHLDLDGLLRVRSRGGNQTEYGVWLTTRTAEVSDFQITDVSLKAMEKGIIVGPSAVEATRLEQVRWLAHKSRIPIYDEGRLVMVAKAVARGLL